MRILFLFAAFLMSFEVSYAQTKSKKSDIKKIQVAPKQEEPRSIPQVLPTQTVAPSTTPAPTAPVIRNSIGGKISQNLRINYYGSYTGPAFDHMDDHQIDNFGKPSSDPQNLWNQLSFNYNLGLKLNFVFNPRFTTQLGSTDSVHKADPKADTGFIYAEDFLTGFQGVVASSGKFTYWARYAVRLPTSYASQLAKIQGQPEAFSDFNYVFNPKFQVGAWQQIRIWKFETPKAAKDQRHWRAYHALYAYYNFSDFFRWDLYYNLTMDHVGTKPLRHLKRGEGYTNYQTGPTFNFTPQFNIYVYAQVNDRLVSWDTAQIGAWISYNDI